MKYWLLVLYFNINPCHGYDPKAPGLSLEFEKKQTNKQNCVIQMHASQWMFSMV